MTQDLQLVETVITFEEEISRRLEVGLISSTLHRTEVFSDGRKDESRINFSVATLRKQNL